MKKKLVIIFLALLALSWYMAVSDTIQKPGKVRACLAKAEELESQEIYVDAITQYEQALVYEPDNTEISMKMAEAYLKFRTDEEVHFCLQRGGGEKSEG